MAVAKQATTIATQAALPVRDLAVEMCTRPWIVELSKNSQRVEETISSKPMFCLVVVGVLWHVLFVFALLTIYTRHFLAPWANWGFPTKAGGKLIQRIRTVWTRLCMPRQELQHFNENQYHDIGESFFPLDCLLELSYLKMVTSQGYIYWVLSSTCVCWCEADTGGLIHCQYWALYQPFYQDRRYLLTIVCRSEDDTLVRFTTAPTHQ